MFFRKKLPFEKITEYLDAQDLLYVRHQKVKKDWNPSFEGYETVLNFMLLSKEYYIIDATDLKGNPINIEATWYHSYSLLQRSKVLFRKIE
tara:strand:+ start:52334 stop:52606 length:273 start_codon:yes stop_codon:yes gene_type:complete